MRVLILGAGAIGGYFGGRLLQAGRAEVASLARGARRAQLERDGLTIDSPLGDFGRPSAPSQPKRPRPIGMSWC